MSQESPSVILAPSEVDRTFVDPDRDAEFRDNGYTTMPVLDEVEVADIAREHAELVGGGGSGMVVDYMRADRTVMAQFNDLLDDVWERHFSSIFVDHRPVFSTCVVKHPGPDSAMFLHEDRSYVDERTARAGTLWIPLVDTGPDIDNGCLHVVPGSHRLAVTFSGSHTPDLIRPFDGALAEALVPVEVPAGHGLFYDTRTLHASPPNRTACSRPAIACAVAPRRAPLIHVVGIDATRRAVHGVDRAFFIEHGPEEIERAMPDGYPVIESFDDPIDHLDPEFVRHCCRLPATPTPEVLVPEDLRDLHEGGPGPVPVETPQRAGALVAVGEPDRWPAETGEPPCDPSDDAWLPASLWPGAELGWWVGEPGLRVLDGSRLCVRLAPRERLELVAAPGADARFHTGAAPPLGAGVVGPGSAAQLIAGRMTTVEASSSVVLWNNGPGDLVVATAFGPTRRRWRDRIRRRRTIRSVRRLVREVRAATA